MEENYNSSLRFIDYAVNDVEFHLNNDFEERAISLNFDIERKVEYVDDEENTIFVTLIVNIFKDAQENNYPFSMVVNLTGIFELDTVDKDKKHTFAEENAVAILFPYIRALVSTFTANVNVAPLILPTINVLKLIKKDEDASGKETENKTE